MDNHKTFNFDEGIQIWEKMNQLIEGGASVRSAAEEVSQEFDVSAATIRGKFQRMLSSGGRAHGHSIFTLEEEETLVGVAQGFSMLHRDLPPSVFKDIVKLFRIRVKGASKETNEWDPSDWLAGFLERHKSKLTPSKIKRLAGIIESDVGTIHHDVRLAAMDVNNDILAPTPTANPISILRVHPTPNQLFSGEEIFRLHQEKVREDEEKKREREEKKRKMEEEKRDAVLIRKQKKTDHVCRGTQHDGGRKPAWK